ncbi:MAG: NAD(P)-dependent oxidoreductase [Rhodospirillaceae bacterium]
MLARYALTLCVALFLVSGSRAQQSTEPPPPVAAPRASIMAEELPRAGAIVVFGADRPLGVEIVKALAGLNKQVTAVIREGSDRAAFEALKVDVTTVDPLVADRLKEMFAAAPLRAVVAPFDVSDEPMLGLDAARNIIEVTKATGVPRFVLVSATGAGDSRDVVPWYVSLLRSDAFAAANAAEEHLKSAGLDFTIVRAGWIIDEEPTGTAAIAEGAPAFSWIANGDLARIVAGTVDAKALSGRTATVVDPQRASLLSVLF